MDSLDFFFYSCVSFQVKVLKREVDDSRWSAALYTALWLHSFVTGIFMSLSICYRNKIADIYVSGKWPWIVLGGIITGLMIWRFFHFIRYESLVTKRQKIKFIWIYYVINWLIIVGAPILAFVTFRLYKYGYV